MFVTFVELIFVVIDDHPRKLIVHKNYLSYGNTAVFNQVYSIYTGIYGTFNKLVFFP